MIADINKKSEERMKKSVHALREELAKLRTGRAHPSLLEHITVDYYGNPSQLSQVANIAVENPRTLMVTPWEKDRLMQTRCLMMRLLPPP